jgi:hypothetical protein
MLYTAIAIRLLWLLGMDATHFYWGSQQRAQQCEQYRGDNIAVLDDCRDFFQQSVTERTFFYMWARCVDFNDPLPYLFALITVEKLCRWFSRTLDAYMHNRYRQSETAAFRAHVERRERLAKRELDYS